MHQGHLLPLVAPVHACVPTCTPWQCLVTSGSFERLFSINCGSALAQSRPLVLPSHPLACPCQCWTEPILELSLCTNPSSTRLYKASALFLAFLSTSVSFVKHLHCLLELTTPEPPKPPLSDLEAPRRQRRFKGSLSNTIVPSPSSPYPKQNPSTNSRFALQERANFEVGSFSAV